MAGQRICKECGGGIMREDYNDESIRIWKCNNCNASYIAKTYKRKLADSGLTVKQEKSIEKIRRNFIKREDLINSGYYEYKKWKITTDNWAGQKVVIIVCEVGRKSAPDSFYNTRGQFFIMPSGKISGHVYEGSREIEAKYIDQWIGR